MGDHNSQDTLKNVLIKKNDVATARFKNVNLELGEVAQTLSSERWKEHQELEASLSYTARLRQA